jgi:hypothetical protein
LHCSNPPYQKRRQHLAEYRILDNDLWQEERTWTTTVRIDDLANLLDEADLLEEITPSKQSGGNTDE